MRYAFIYPVLQPIAERAPGKLEAQPFSTCATFLRLRVYQEAGLSSFDEDFLGQVLLPLKLLAEAAPHEVQGWVALGSEPEGGLALKPTETAVNLLVRAVMVMPGEAGVAPTKAQIEESRAFEGMLEETAAAQSG